MLSANRTFRQQLIADNRDYKYRIEMTLDDGTRLSLKNDDVWSDSVTFEEGTSSTDSFDIGGAVIGQCKLALNNIYDKFSDYNFFNATFYIDVGLVVADGTTDYIRKGYYTVNQADYNGSLITLSCYDNMWRFDVPYADVRVSYPISATTLVSTICSHCNVTLANSMFNNYTTQIPAPNTDTEMNCREVLSYIGQMCCVYFKINPQGRLSVGWYDKSKILDIMDADGGTFKTTTTPYSDGDSLDGGTFAYNDGDSFDGGTFDDFNKIAYLTSNSSMKVGTDNILVTGVKTLSEDTDNPYEYLVGSTGYVLTISGNPFINPNNANLIATQVGNIVIGTVFRTFNSSTLSDPTYEAGDVCAITDFKGNRFYSFITNLTFNGGGYETFSCGAVTPTQANTVRFSEAVKTAVQIARKAMSEKISDYDIAVQNMNTLACNAMGLRWAEKKNADGTSVFYMSDKQMTLKDNDTTIEFTEKSKVWKMTGDGFFICMSAKQKESQCVWTNGWDSSGNLVANSIATIGITFDWAHGGTLKLGGTSNTNGQMTIYDNNNNLIGSWNKDGVLINGGSFKTKTSEKYVEINNGQINVGYVENGYEYRIGGLAYATRTNPNTSTTYHTLTLESNGSYLGFYQKGNYDVTLLHHEDSTYYGSSEIKLSRISIDFIINSNTPFAISETGVSIKEMYLYDNETTYVGGNEAKTTSVTVKDSGNNDIILNFKRGLLVDVW